MDIYFVRENADAGKLGFLKSAGATVFSSPAAESIADKIADSLSLDRIISRSLGAVRESLYCMISFAEYFCSERPAIIVAPDLSADLLARAGAPASEGVVQFEYDGDLSYVGLL